MNSILLITSSYPAGSGEEFLEDEIRAMASTGTVVHVVPTHPRGSVRGGLPSSDHIHYHVCGLASLEVLARSARLLARRPSSVVNALRVVIRSRRHIVRNLSAFPKALWVAQLASDESVQRIHASWLSVPSTVALVSARVTGTPWSATGHRWDIYNNNLLELKSREASFIRFISARGRRDAIELGVLESSSVVLHLGTRTSFADRTEEQLREPLTLICPANLIRLKGHSYLLQALALMDAAKRPTVILFGDGELREELRALAAVLGVKSSVEFRGQVARRELLATYAAIGRPAVVLPSLELGGGEHEGIPYSLIEAMALGVPAIATDTGSVSELLAGLPGLVPAQDPPALVSAFERLQGDVEDYHQLSRSCFERVDADWNAERSGRRLLELMWDCGPFDG